ncbi:MAG: hypothetical protein VXY77_03790 [Pseudomonadota bacterium]|nr:hypothetical protein [Pseudomonadota bacterium]
MSGGIEAAWLAHFINNYPINVLIVGYGPLSSDFDMRQRIVALVNRCVPYTILSIASKANIHRRVKNLVMTLAIKVPCKLGFNIALLAIYNWVRPVTAKRFQTSECCGNESQHQPLESISITSNLLEGRCFMWDQARLATRRLGWFSRQVKPIIPEKSAFYDRGNIEFANSSI